MEIMLTSLTLGLLATASPCILPLYPGFLAYIAGGQQGPDGRRGRYLLGFFVLAGVLTMMLALGALIAVLSISVGRALAVIIPFSDAVIVLLGVLLLLDINPFKRLPQIRVPLVSHPFVNAFVYGLLYGPLTLPCSGALVISVFAVSLTMNEIAGRLAVFFWFGMGFGLPLLALSLLSGAAQHWITRQFALHSRAINVLSGVLLVGVGIYDLASNWDLIMLFLK